MSSQGTSTAAFVLSLIGGVLILMGSLVSALWFMSGGFSYEGMMGGYGSMMGGFGGMMGGYENMMHDFGMPYGMMSGLSLISLVAGILVIIGAIMLTVRPTEHMTWAIIVLVFSIISFLGMGGFFIGALLGIAGGALALSTRPRIKT